MRRAPLMAIGVILCVLGVGGLIWPRIGYTQRETLVDVGSLNITADTQKSWPVPPILGGIALAGGVGLLVLGARKS